MRRMVVCLLTLALLVAPCAVLAEASDYIYIGDMQVVNCEEWVSLRAEPSTAAERLAKVPLGAWVTDGEWVQGNGDFVRCLYDGQYGYILSSYLTADTGADAALDVQLGSLRVLAERAYVGDGEYLLVTCEDADGSQRWFYETMTSYETELTLTDAFIGGWAQDPFVMVYNAEKGLTALDAFTGDVRWILTPDQIDLGASLTHALGDDGTLYIGGYYGPDPVAIDGYGNVLWQSDSQGCAWLHQINLGDDVIACNYDLMDDTDDSGWVYFNYDGSLHSKRPD